MGRWPGTRPSDPSGDLPVRIRVDPDACQGHARCVSLAPKLFDVDDYGSSTARNEGRVPPELEAQAHLAIANCPEFAISEIDEP